MAICSLLLTLMTSANAAGFEEVLTAIRGKVLTADGLPAASVSVQIKNLNRGTTTDQNGEFIFRKIKPGRYTLQVSLVGYENVEEEVTVENDKIASVTLNMKTSGKELQEVIVGGGRNKYKVDEVSSSLRLQTPVLEVPQNIQIVSSQILADQQVFDVVDGITRNVSGASRVGHWDNQYAQIRMRGSKIPAFRNGMNIEASWGPTAEDASMIERIEFVKGPAGFMLANGEPGGFYNVVTKKPTGVTKGSAIMSMGSFSTYRAALDFDGKLSKDGRLLYRLNLAGQQKDMYTKYNYNNRYVLAPSFKYLIDDKTSVTLEYTLQASKFLSNGNYHFSSRSLLDPDISNDFFYGDPSIAPSQIRDHNIYAYLDHKLNENWNLHAQVAYFNFAMNGSTVWANRMYANGDMERSYSIGDEAGENRFAQFSFTGEERTGGIRHRILGGIDMGNKKFWGDFRSLSTNLKMTGNAMFNVYNPVYGLPFDSIPKLDRSLDVRTRAGASTYISVNTYGSVYLQDELAFFNDRLRLSLAGRFTHSETVGKTKTTGISDDVVTPRVGLSYSIDQNTAVYALYDQSYVPVSGLDSNNNPFKSIRGNDIEAGIKKEWLNGRWRSTVSVYRITRENSLVAEPSGRTINGRAIQLQLGETETKGVEVDINGEIVPGLNATVNYAYTDAKITKEAPGVAEVRKTVGNVPSGTANHITNGWLQYNLRKGALKGFGLTGGFQWLADRYTGTSKTPNMPNYFRTDGGVNFQRGKYNISLLVNNLADNRKLLTAASIPAVSGTTVPIYTYIVEARRNFRMSIAYRF